MHPMSEGRSCFSPCKTRRHPKGEGAFFQGESASQAVVSHAPVTEVQREKRLARGL
jgi:hypothetical protein